MKLKNLIIHIMFALVLIANAMPLVFQREGTFILSMAFAIGVIIVTTSLKTIKSIKDAQIVFAAFCLLLFLFSYIPVNTPQAHESFNVYLRWFLFAGIGTLLITNYKYDFELLMRIFVVDMLLMAPVITTTNYSRFVYDAGNDEWMMMIYSIVPLIVASVYYLFLGENKWFKLLAVASLILYFPTFILHTSRGAVVTLVLAVVVFVYHRQKEKGVRINMIITECIVALVVLVVAFEFIISYFQQISDMYDLRWLAKFVSSEDMSNGRTPLYDMAFNGFEHSPIWGQGIASFDNYNSYSYPHNLFLQMLYETGILMFIPVSYLIYQAILVIIMKKKSSFDYRIITFLFLISIIQLLFSSYFWKRQQFWILIWMMLFNLTQYFNNKKLKRHRLRLT